MTNTEKKQVTVRTQKIRKSHIRQKLIFFLVLAGLLILAAVFSDRLCPYVRMHRIWQVPCSHQGRSI